MTANKEGDGESLQNLSVLLKPVEGESFEGARSRLRLAGEVSRDLVARQFEGYLNRRFREVETDTLDAKIAFAREVNADLRLLGVAIRCPKTGAPAFLRADGSRNGDRGRFQLCVKRGGRTSIVLTRAGPFNLELRGSLRCERMARRGESVDWVSSVERREPDRTR